MNTPKRDTQGTQRRDCAVDKFDWWLVDRTAVISEAVDFHVIFEIEILPNAKLLQSDLASNHVFRKPFIVFLDEKFLVFSAAALASLFLLVSTSPLFRHVAENSVCTCVQIFDQ